MEAITKNEDLEDSLCLGWEAKHIRKGKHFHRKEENLTGNEVSDKIKQEMQTDPDEQTLEVTRA